MADFTGYSDISPSFTSMFGRVSGNKNISPVVKERLLNQYMTSLGEVTAARSALTKQRDERRLRELSILRYEEALNGARTERAIQEQKIGSANEVQSSVKSILTSGLDDSAKQRNLLDLLVSSDAYLNPESAAAIRYGIDSLGKQPTSAASNRVVDDYVSAFKSIEHEKDRRGEPTNKLTDQAKGNILGYYVKYRPEKYDSMSKMSDDDLKLQFVNDMPTDNAPNQLNVSSLFGSK